MFYVIMMFFYSNVVLDCLEDFKSADKTLNSIRKTKYFKTLEVEIRLIGQI